MVPRPAPLPPPLAGREERVAGGLDAEDDELVAAGLLLLLQQRRPPQVGGHADGADLVRLPTAAALRARRRLTPRGRPVPDMFARPEGGEIAAAQNLLFLMIPMFGQDKNVTRKSII